MRQMFRVLFLSGFLASCTPHDMATYTRLSPNSAHCCAGKVVLLSPNLYGIDEDIFQATTTWIKKTLMQEGYQFDDQKKATVLVSINHQATESTKTEPDLNKTQEVFEGEGTQAPAPIYNHHLTVMVEDLSCAGESMTIDVDVETYSDRLTDSIPDLLESLDDSFAKAKSPKSKVVKRILRKV
jgi:hypothetical protein